jgi:Protein of unknown function (DUF2628)
MRTYTIHERPDPAADRVDRAEDLVFIKDGFSWAAALFAPLWLIAHRLWWALLGYVIVSGVFQLAQLTAAFDQRWLGLAAFALNILIGFEADTLRRWALERRGWHTVATVSGTTAAECERRFFDSWLPAQPILAAGSQSRPPSGGGWQGVGRLLGARS